MPKAYEVEQAPIPGFSASPSLDPQYLPARKPAGQGLVFTESFNEDVFA